MCVNETKFCTTQIQRAQLIRVMAEVCGDTERGITRRSQSVNVQWDHSDKPRDAAARKCQSPTVLHVCVNSGQINSLKDGIIIKERFDSSELMAWPLKFRLSKH